MDKLIKHIICNKEPCIEYYGRKYLGDHELSSEAENQLQLEIKRSPLVRSLLSEMNGNGEIPCDPYKKWYGTHWVLYSLAEVNYPRRGDEIKGLIDQAYTWLFSTGFLERIKEVKGLMRGHACIVGNALYYLSKLWVPDERLKKLKELLMTMQWHDGGWNCDRKPKARKSSLVTTCIAVRGLNQYKNATQDDSVNEAINGGIGYMLDHQLCKTRSSGEIIHPDMVKFFYPEYYHYSILYALRVLVEAEYPCNDKIEFALDYLERSKQEYGWSINKKYYWKAKKDRAGKSLVNWGSIKQNEMNIFVTTYAIHILKYYRSTQFNK